MNKELVKKLLSSKTPEEFNRIIDNEKKDYDHDITLWDNNEVIEHCLELFDLTYEQFKWGFNPTPPKDYEEAILLFDDRELDDLNDEEIEISTEKKQELENKIDKYFRKNKIEYEDQCSKVSTFIMQLSVLIQSKLRVV